MFFTWIKYIYVSIFQPKKFYWITLSMCFTNGKISRVYKRRILASSFQHIFLYFGIIWNDKYLWLEYVLDKIHSNHLAVLKSDCTWYRAQHNLRHSIQKLYRSHNQRISTTSLALVILKMIVSERYSRIQ